MVLCQTLCGDKWTDAKDGAGDRMGGPVNWLWKCAGQHSVLNSQPQHFSLNTSLSEWFSTMVHLQASPWMLSSFCCADVLYFCTINNIYCISLNVLSSNKVFGMVCNILNHCFFVCSVGVVFIKWWHSLHFMDCSQMGLFKLVGVRVYWHVSHCSDRFVCLISWNISPNGM